MSLSPKEEYGVELSGWHPSEPVTDVPIKKRRFFFRQSPSPPPSHSTAFTVDNCEVQTKEATFPSLGTSLSGSSSGQMPDMICADFRDPSLELGPKSVIAREVNLPPNGGTSTNLSDRLLFTLSTAAATGVGNEGKPISENKPAVKPIAGTISETIEFRSTLGDGNCVNKLILSEKSAFQRVLSNTGRFEPSLGEPTALVSSANEGQPDSCKLELSLSENQSTSPSKRTDAELGYSHDNRRSNRSHWDLNTTMDTWERSIIETTSNDAEFGKNKVDLGFIDSNKPGVDSTEKSRQESTGMQVMSGKRTLTENDGSQLPNIVKPVSENSSINTDLNLQLNTAFGSTGLSNLAVPLASYSPSSHKMFNLSLPVKPTTVTACLKLATRGAVKTEPLEDVGSGKNAGVSNFKSVNHGIIKSEALDVVGQQSVETICLNGMRSTCEDAVKLEQLEVPCPEGLRTSEGKGPRYQGCSSNAQEKLNTGEMHHIKEGSSSSSLHFVQGSIVDFNKKHDLEIPNVSASPVMGESVNEAAPVVGTETLVLSDAMLVIGQDMPSKSDEPHDASSDMDNPKSIIPESVISNVDNSHNTGPISVHGRQQDTDENVIRASENFSEFTVIVCNESNQAKGASEGVYSTSSVLPEFEQEEQKDADHLSGIVEQISYSGSGTQIPAVIPVDTQAMHTSIDSKAAENDAKGEINNPELFKIENEPYDSNETAGVKGRVSKQHSDDDDYEDGEFRESLLRIADKGSSSSQEQKDFNIKEGVTSDVPPAISTTVFENEGNVQNPDESKDVHCTMESESHVCPENNDAGLNMPEDVKESSVIEKPITESSKKKAVKISRKMPPESGKEDPESKSANKRILFSSLAKSPDNAGSDLGGQQVNQFGPSKAGVSRTYDVTKCAKGRSDCSHIARINSSSNAPSPGRIKSSHSKSSSRSERERIKDKYDRREKVHMKSSRDENHIHRMHKSENERDPDQAFRKAGPDRVHMRGRIIQQLDSLRGEWEPDHGAGRTGKKHVDDELCRPPPRRPSPGGSGPLPLGVPMVRRTMRDISPDDMVNSSLVLRNRPNFEPGRNCLIRRERSLSPFQRRAAHVSSMFASSTRPRARSPHLWSPPRRPDVFDGLPDMIRCRSPDLRVERMRSPGERPCFQDNILGRRHISPRVAQLHGEMTDVNLLRGHDLPKPGRHPQGNLRRFDLIDHRVNPDNFGHLQPGQFRGLEGDEVYAEERRNSDGGHGLGRPFRQHYIVGDDVSNDGSFHHRVEDIPPRSIRLCQDEDEEFPGRGISRVGSIRNRLGNIHNRRLRGMNEQDEDSYRHDSGQGWHGGGFKDVRLKRRRF